MQPSLGNEGDVTAPERPDPAPEAEKSEPAVSKPNFAGAVLLAALLVIAWGFNLAAAWVGGSTGAHPVVPSWLLYGLMGGILFLLGVDISKVFRGRGDS